MSRREREKQRSKTQIAHRREANPRGVRRQDKAKLDTRTETQRRVEIPTFNRQSYDFSQKVTSTRNEHRSSSFKANNLPSRVNQLDNNNSISTRIANIQSEGYKLPANTGLASKEPTQRRLSPLWGIHSFESIQSNPFLQGQKKLQRASGSADSLNDPVHYENQLWGYWGTVNKIEEER